MNRFRVRRRFDRRFFTRTASRTKDVNLGIVNYRGGIRL